MTEPLYARLCENVNLHIRRGAWYRVLKLEDLHATIEVNREPVRWPKPCSNSSSDHQPADRGATARQLDRGPAQRVHERVCRVPELCRARVAPAQVKRMGCPCKWEFEVAWDEHYLR
jgi:hypothetical protein